MTNKRNSILFLRSEKVRSIVGQIPPSMVRYGISIIAGVILLLLFLSYLVPIREYEIIKMNLNTRPSIQICKMLTDGIFYSSTSTDKVIKGQMIGSIHNGIDSVQNFYSCLYGNLLLFCENGDYLKKGEVIFSIVPDTISQILGTSYVNSNLNKQIRKGQQVFFYHPNMSDYIVGSISKTYPVETRYSDSTWYKIEVVFDKSTFSNLQQKSFLHIGTEGTAKILITDKSFLKRIISIGE